MNYAAKIQINILAQVMRYIANKTNPHFRKKMRVMLGINR